MPITSSSKFELRPVGKSRYYKVFEKQSDKSFSDKGMSRSQAIRQMRALYANVGKLSGGRTPRAVLSSARAVDPGFQSALVKKAKQLEPVVRKSLKRSRVIESLPGIFKTVKEAKVRAKKMEGSKAASPQEKLAQLILTLDPALRQQLDSQVLSKLLQD